ncbi:helix-turn-helix transcriptional regulator [Campylobacter sp. MOP7]|uniref:helix-turn-helix transcriptional regulator n=1 Tax=Campylobacter canis TaxID=3378588 RepID=UPI00387E687D
MNGEFLTTKQVKALYGWCDTTLWRYVKAGYIEKRKLGPRTVLYPKASIDKFIAGAVKVVPGETKSC